MTRRRATRPLAVAGLLLVLAACAQPGGAAPEAPGSGVALPDDPDALVIQARYVGGFVTPETTLTQLPLVSIYADGRVITEGPVVAIYPGPAWPNVQEHRIDPARVRELVARALDAGVADDADLGMPPVADVPSTRFTVSTADETFVREVYALVELPGETGLTDEQEAARAQLRGLLEELTGVVGVDGDAYTPDAVAAVVRPWWDPEDGLEQPELAWPGPALPGEPVGADLTCVTTTGPEAAALRTAAAEANTLTPWLSADGARWSVTFRPLLPGEHDCAALVEG